VEALLLLVREAAFTGPAKAKLDELAGRMEYLLDSKLPVGDGTLRVDSGALK
jgi:hypothetical protein